MSKHYKPVLLATESPSLLRIKENNITKLKQVNDDLDDLCYHEPSRHREVEAKMSIVNKMIQEKLADARQLILRIAQGCDLCHPDEWWKRTNHDQVSQN